MLFANITRPIPASLRNGAPMLYVSLMIEALRARPTQLFWIATLSQAVLWTLVPTLFYAAPPGDVPLVLAVGREWQLGSPYGPPLAYWAAEFAFELFGNSMFGVYLLSQVCIVITFWTVFRLGRSIVGTQHALMAVLLMAGIVSFSVPTPEFSPSVLATPLTALALLHYWRAVGEGRRNYWFLVAMDLGLLLLTTYSGVLLVGLLVVFTGATERGRATLGSIDPWAAGLIVVLAVFPHLVWLEWMGAANWPELDDLPDFRMADGRSLALMRLFLWLVVAQGGMLVLIAVAGGLSFGPRQPAPVFERRPVDPFAARFVYTFALAPAALVIVFAVLAERVIPVGGAGPLVILSGLAVVIAAGDAITLHRQRSLGVAWLSLLLLPAMTTLASIVLMPWIAATDLPVARPANAMGQFFTDNFRRRTGKPLEIVIGDLRLGGLVALASPDRPHLFIDASSDRAPWLSDEDVRRHGAVVIWNATDLGPTPPAALKERYSDLVAEVPRTFERPVQGRLPLLRIGWAVIRPQGDIGASDNTGPGLRGAQPPQ